MSNIEWEGATALVELDEYPGYRFKVDPDGDASNPVEDSGCSVDVYAFRGGYTSTASKVDGDWAAVFARFYELYDAEQALELTQRYARVFKGWTLDETQDRLIIHNMRGYSQSDWQDLFVAVHNEGDGTAKGWAEEWSLWANGDVYGVEAQKLDEDEEWETVNTPHGFETLWGIYADDAEEAAKYYAEESGLAK